MEQQRLCPPVRRDSDRSDSGTANRAEQFLLPRRRWQSSCHHHHRDDALATQGSKHLHLQSGSERPHSVHGRYAVHLCRLLPPDSQGSVRGARSDHILLHHRIPHEHHHGRRQPLRTRRSATQVLRHDLHDDERHAKYRRHLAAGDALRTTAPLRLRRVRIQREDGRLLPEARHLRVVDVHEDIRNGVCIHTRNAHLTILLHQHRRRVQVCHLHTA